ncbi:MAG TPA: WYL domain-containing protein [Gemmatimonadota bacterium]|nr:WYL domain-containing protein [Gemmatimonadota bacterium]
MTPREATERQLERVLHVIPVAARPDGASLAELATDLGVSEERLLRDIGEVTARANYLEPPLDIDILIEEGRVTVWTTGEFRRPVKLSPREALALTLGLRLLAEGAAAARAETLRALAARLDRALAHDKAAALAEDFALGAGDPSGEGHLAVLQEAARERRPCGLRYLKPADARPQTRELHPYALVHAGGRWYALGHCPESDGVRAFRLDRILSVRPLDGSFAVPDDFDPRDYIDRSGAAGGKFRAEQTVDVTVRYSPRIARWIEENARGNRAGRHGGDESADRAVIARLADGSVEVVHRVADPGWLVRHVLYHGPDAEVVAPPEIRDLMRQRIEQVIAAQGDEGWLEAAS